VLVPFWGRHGFLQPTAIIIITAIITAIALGIIAYKIPKLAVIFVSLAAVLIFIFLKNDYKLPYFQFSVFRSLGVPFALLLISLVTESGILLGMSYGICFLLLINNSPFLSLSILVAATLLSARGRNTESIVAIFIFLGFLVPEYFLSSNFPGDYYASSLLSMGVGALAALCILAFSHRLEKRNNYKRQPSLWLTPSLAAGGGILVYLIIGMPFGTFRGYPISLWDSLVFALISFILGIIGSLITKSLKKHDFTVKVSADENKALTQPQAQIISQTNSRAWTRDLTAIPGKDVAKPMALSQTDTVPQTENIQQPDNSHSLVQSRIKAVMGMIAGAQELYKKQDYYKAKERYRETKSCLENIRDFAVEHHLDNEKVQVEKLIDDCTTNIINCTNFLIEKPEIIAPTLKVNTFTPHSVISSKIQPQTEDDIRMMQLGKELKDEYGEITWLEPGGDNYIGLAQKDATTVILRLPKKLDADRKKSFLKEWEAWKNLGQHSNIVTLIGENISPPLLVLEYVDGGSLDDYLKQPGVKDVKISCHIINDIARGLEYAHSQKAIHGDLKPGNILLTKTMEAKITDWNLGKSYTPGYAAPEQYRGQRPSEKTDIYQLGVIFYEIICGDNPFNHGSIVEKETKAIKWSAPNLSSYSTRYEPLDDITQHCLDKNPEKRPTLKEFRITMYQYLKSNHDYSLSLSRDLKNQITELSDLAVLAAKQNDTRDLEATLESLLRKLPEERRRKLIEDSNPVMSQIIINYNQTYNDSVVQVKSNPTYHEQDRIIHETETLVRGAMRMAVT
jgi:serine/threonine protein kinase